MEELNRISSLSLLPPTPEDFELCEAVLADLSRLRTETDEVMRIVSEHAFGGFPRAAIESLSQHIAEAVTAAQAADVIVLGE